MCTICATLRPYDTDCAYAGLAASGGSTSVAAAAPTYSLDQVARFLNTGFWGGNGPRHFDVSPGEQLTYNIGALTPTGQSLARQAFDAWADVTGIVFVEVTGSAAIAFDDEAPGAYASYSYVNGHITSAVVNVNKNWAGGSAAIDSYHYQTYLHEIGHALGLGHGGNYNGSADFGTDNHYANDSWQISVMSYFSQWENTSVNASFAFAITPMAADILAIQQLYGSPGTRTGNTVYGEGGNTGTYLDGWLSLSQSVALTLYDGGGHDLIDLSSQGHAQRIDLRPEGISDVQGQTGNLIVARDTVIEAVATGGGDDHVTGNAANNTLTLGAGADFGTGAGGNDLLEGDAGNDHLRGGSGSDQLRGGSGSDTLLGGHDADTLLGGSEADTLFGERGDDVLYGEDGNDWLVGGNGRDLVSGDLGDDSLHGGGGNDRLFGGDGADVLNGGMGRDVLWGEAGNDVLNGSGGKDVLLGHDDSDILAGGGGKDRLFGGSGADTVMGGGGRDRLSGEAGDDVLAGGGGKDKLSGGDGADVLIGGAGKDRLVGGADSDTFVFANGCGNDLVADFDATDPNEVIDLSGLSAIADWADLAANHLSFQGALCIIDAGGGNQIRLPGVSSPDLDASDFLF